LVTYSYKQLRIQTNPVLEARIGEYAKTYPTKNAAVVALIVRGLEQVGL